MIEAGSDLSGRQLSRGEPFPFCCHPGLACFNGCCRDKRLMLLPYDVLRLARGLGVATGEFLAEHAELETDPASGWPALRLRLAAGGRCPFVGQAGCAVYRDRPACCRLYPLARGVRLDTAGEPRELLVLAEPGPGCLGLGDPGRQTVADWLGGQGLDPYRAASDRVARLLLHPGRPRPLSLPPSEVHAVVMALYNLDVFREFAARPGFAGRSGMSPERVALGLASDEALLELSQDWLAARLFGR